uniref:Trans-1,2-dihydrobenzene-1,2-diol dehydrogenase n=1 Tax=Knipowitschia caucasica TaxID=637954 RepID=A0AAV2LQM3_KNICA
MATRWGLCGAGKISHDFSVAMKTLPPGDHQIAVVASRSLERAQEFAKKHSIPKAYGSYEELASDPDIVHAEVRKLLAEEAVGEVKMVKAYFGSPQLHIPRSVEKELGGGALLDIGVYCLQFVLMVFRGERPLSIQASGVLLDSGVDESVVVALKFSRNRMAFCAFSISARLPNDAVICGTEGSIKVLGPMHCPTTLVVNDKQAEYPLPEPCMPVNFTNSTGLRYEAQEVRQCLLKGLKESPLMPLSESVLLTEIMDEIRKQVGVVFSQDNQ